MRELHSRALRLAENPSLWQRVLHGGACALRREVVKVLLDVKGEKGGFRYAACGLADQLVQRGGEVYNRPKGCGHKLCPRCGRRRGGKHARKIIGWLAYEPHGDLLSMCLTQRVRRGEDAAGARERMAQHQRDYMRALTRRGMTAGMTCVHLTWSPRAEGWHYHVHILADMPAGTTTPRRLRAMWRLERWGENIRVGDKASRVVCDAGPAIVELREDSGDVDFWGESKGAVAKAVQYPLRDLVQGVTAWRLGGDDEQLKRCAFQLVTQCQGWKMFRAWGAWRKSCPAAVAAKEAEAKPEEGEAAGKGSPVPLGTVGRVWRAARKGDRSAREAFRLLESGCRNASDFARRLVKYCRLARAGPDSG